MKHSVNMCCTKNVAVVFAYEDVWDLYSGGSSNIINILKQITLSQKISKRVLILSMSVLSFYIRTTNIYHESQKGEGNDVSSRSDWIDKNCGVTFKGIWVINRKNKYFILF